MQVSIKDLKNNLSSYLKIVGRGQELVITSHHHPIAKIIPISDEAIAGKVDNAFFAEIQQLHQQLSKVKLKTTMRDSVLKGRKDERSW
ncbi:MAG: type II toxin-antitoxin system Phd/YefM family antitoxin [Gammaproteobacteria bacterium]